MFKKQFLIFSILFFLLTFKAAAQNRFDLQTLPEENSRNLQLWYEQVEWLKQHPIDVNRASASDFLQIPGLSEALATELVTLRKRHGQFRTKSALQKSLKLNSEDWLWLAQFIRVKKQASSPRATLRFRLGPAENFRTNLPSQKSYQRVTWAAAGGVSGGFLLLKPSGNPGPRLHAVGFVALPFGQFGRVWVGDYFLHFGQGLVFNLPYSFGKGQSPAHILRPPGAFVRGDLSSLGGFYLRGANLQWQTENWRGVLFASQNRWQAALDSLSGTARLLSSQNGSGKQVKENLAGFHLKFSWKYGHFGFSGFKSCFSRPVTGLHEEVPLRNLTLLGTTGRVRVWRFTFSGALARIPKRQPSFLLGAEIRLAKLEWVWLFRRYGTNFWNPHALVFGEEDDPTNEQGVYTGLVFRPFRRTHLEIFLDQFRFPGASLGFPNRQGWEWRLRWRQTWGRGVRTLFTLAQKDRQEKHAVLRNGWQVTRVLAFRDRWKWQFFWWLFPKAAFHIKGQIQFVRVAWPFLPQNLPSRSGFLLTQECRWNPAGPFSLAFGWSLFQTESYESRLYLYEPGLPGTFPIFLAYGTGSRFFILPQIRLGKWGRFSLKYASQNRVSKPGVNYRISPPEPPRGRFALQADFHF